MLAGDANGLLASGERGVLEISAETRSGMTRQRDSTRLRVTGSKPHGTQSFKRPYNEMVYQPMLELLAYLRVNQVQNLRGVWRRREFMRAFAPGAYRIAPNQDRRAGHMGKLS